MLSGVNRDSKKSPSVSYEGGRRVYNSKNNNELKISELQSISLGLLTKENLELESVIDLADSLTDKSSVNDIKMGPINSNQDCPTCQESYEYCQGHFGMLSFPEEAAFIHPYYLETGMVTALLNIFCFDCSNEGYNKATILFTDVEIAQEEKNLYHVEGEKRIKNLARAATGNTCSVCSKKHVEFEVSKNFQIVRKIPSKGDSKSDESEVPIFILLQHFRAITKFLDTYQLHGFIGFERVDYTGYVVRAIPIIPPRNRPPNHIAGNTSESTITELYMHMMDIVYKIKDLMNRGSRKETDQTLEAAMKALRDHYACFITGKCDNINIKGKSMANNQALMVLKTIIDKKHGLRQGNTVSARVNNSGRTVIICDNSIKPGEAKIPRFMAEIFRLTVKITAENISYVTQLLRREVVKAVISDKKQHPITEDNYDTYVLQIGDIVKRRLLTGDVVIINRQPSLHRWNNIACKAVVEENLKDGEEDVHAIGLNTAYVSGLNADFDGDEAHIHVPDSMQARAEAAFLMAPEKAPINDKDSKNIFTIIQNSVWGAYTMTKYPRKIPREQWYDMTKNIQDFTGPRGSYVFDYQGKIKYIEENAARILNQEGVTGLGIYNTYTLISMAFPSDFSYMDMIVEGIFVRGVMKKSVSGAGEESIIRHMFESHGSTAISVYVHVMQQITASYMNVVSHTLSLSDFCPSDDLKRRAGVIIEEGLSEAKKISQRSIKGVFDHDGQFGYEVIVVEKLKNLPNELSLIFDGEIKNRFIQKSSNDLFDVLQSQKNRFYKGLSEKFFDRDLVRKSLKRSVEKYIVLPDLNEENFVPGNLIAVLKRERDPKEKQKALLFPQLREAVYEAIVEYIVDFTENSVTNPMESENLVCMTKAELATIEADTMDNMDAIKERAGGLLKDESDTGSLGQMIDSGARGNIGNQINATVLLGQQTMSDARLEPKISNGTRVNAFFLENSPDPKARGFVAESLYQGLSPQGWLSSAMPSRQTQMDTNFKTKDTGYAAKKMMAAAGDYVVRGDGTVRDEQDRIISFSPAHFIDPSRMIRRGNVFSVVNCKQLYNEVKAAHDAKEKSIKEYNRKW